MKKLLALVLALIMVLGLGVVAFAETAVAKMNVIVLDEETEDDDELETLKLLPDAKDAESGLAGDSKKVETVYLVGPGGDDYYVEIDTTDLKNITVSATGNVTAEIVEFDPEEMEYAGYKYFILDEKKEPHGGSEVYIDGLKAEALSAEDAKWHLNITNPGMNNGEKVKVDLDKVTDDYDGMDYAAGKLNEIYKSKRFTVKAFELKEIKVGNSNVNKYVEAKEDLLKITVADNYSAAYKEGTVKVSAYNKALKEDVVANLTIISDVTIFEYEEVKWAAEEDEALLIGTNGYSDYKTAQNGYGDKYDSEAIKNVEGELGAKNATVVSTTAFRAIEGEELTVAADANNYVEIEEIVKGQKGVNFAFEGFKFYDEDDEKLFAGNVKDRKGNIIADNWKKVKGDVEYITFGFLGNQVINSDFTIYVNPQISYYELRELFGKKVEEEDVLTYYVLKDGVKIDEFTVDYKDDDVDDYVELEILGKAGDKLGFYTLTLDAPAAEEGEENPNTGAESVVGVVAAMAVVSLVAAAAVSLKK